MSVKELAIKSISSLPEDADWEQIRDRIAFISGVEKGVQQLDEGKGIPVEMLKSELNQWLQK